MPSPDQYRHLFPAVPEDHKLPLVVIVGPTAVGKTEIAIELAERLGGEIVSADSRLFYRGMDIGTAKPTIEQRSRVPHHLIDVANPDESWSLALFQREANKAIELIYQNHHLPIMVGGTGQFIHAVVDGWVIPPSSPNRQLRAALSQWSMNIGPAGIHARLATIDPEAARRIDPGNVRRTIRALEVIFMTGRRFSEQRIKGLTRYNSLLIGLMRPRPELYQRIDARIENMITAGLVEEVKQLLAQGYSPELPTLSAIGYGEIVAYLRGIITLDEAIVRIKHRTRVFVRRQANWFKLNDPTIHWFWVGEATRDDIGELIEAWLRTTD